MREWQGTTHQVTVVNDGFLWNGETYRWSKHHEWEKFIDLPRRTTQKFELAMNVVNPDRQKLLDNGWQLFAPGLAAPATLRPRCSRRLRRTVPYFAQSRGWLNIRSGDLTTNRPSAGAEKWRKRVRVERTGDPLGGPPAGFEDRDHHRMTCASVCEAYHSTASHCTSAPDFAFSRRGLGRAQLPFNFNLTGSVC